jgi:putative phage-type endonuclease
MSETRTLWLAERRRGIGGSDAAACAGLSRWTTPLEVYENKTSDADRDETPEMRRGTLLEPVVRQMYADATGHSVAQPAGIIQSEEHPFMLASLDGVVQDSRRLLECKTARDKSEWGEPGSAEIPIEYLCQCQHYLRVARYDVIDVAVLFGNGFEFAIYEIPADPEFQDLLIEAEIRLWDHVQKRIPPEPINTDDVRRRWPRAKFQSATIATADDYAVAQALAQIKAHAKALEAIQEQCEAYLKMRIGDNEALTCGDKIVATWKNKAGTRRFDGKRLEKEHPEIHRQYVTVGEPSRMFLLKEKSTSCLTTNKTITIPNLPAGLLLPTPMDEEATPDS